MKKYLEQLCKPIFLPAVALSGGILTMLMRFWLYGLGIDERGLLPAATFPDIFSWILTALVLVYVFLSTRPLTGAAKYSFNFHPSLPAAIGSLAGAVGIFITCLIELISGGERLGIFSALFGLFASVALGFVAYCRKGGLKPNSLVHSVVCIWLMFHLVSHYRLWSSFPQLQTYAFELLAIIFLMLSCYQRTAFDAGHGDRKAYSFYTSAATFFCVAAVPGSYSAIFFLGCAAWMFTTPCNLKAVASTQSRDA